MVSTVPWPPPSTVTRPHPVDDHGLGDRRRPGVGPGRPQTLPRRRHRSRPAEVGRPRNGVAMRPEGGGKIAEHDAVDLLSRDVDPDQNHQVSHSEVASLAQVVCSDRARLTFGVESGILGQRRWGIPRPRPPDDGQQTVPAASIDQHFAYGSRERDLTWASPRNTQQFVETGEDAGRGKKVDPLPWRGKSPPAIPSCGLSRGRFRPGATRKKMPRTETGGWKPAGEDVGGSRRTSALVNGRQRVGRPTAAELR